MVIDLKMCRFENVPWGFRLVGGADFDVPLTVIKVTEGSLAEQAGMKVGDIIVRINDEPTVNMTHNDAHHVISKCGNNFFFGVLREGFTETEVVSEMVQQQQQQQQEHEEIKESVVEEITSESHIKEELEKTTEFSISQTCEETIVQKSEEIMTEKAIAEMMSGEAELLKEHNVIGVNFNRIFPKPGICQSSEVLRTLNEEAIKTKTEIEKEKRKWTTFLQKPNRPIPKDKNEVEEQRINEPYKVRIVKQSKPRVAPDRTPSPPPVHAEPKPETEVEPISEIKAEENKEANLPLPTDSEVPNLEHILESEDNKKIEDNVQEKTTDEEEILAENIGQEKEANTNVDQKTVQEEITIQKTEEELQLEKQLADVQKQLLALSNLPSTIQATLDAVTKQLSELLPSFKLQPKFESSAAVAASSSSETQQSEEAREEISDLEYKEDEQKISETSIISQEIQIDEKSEEIDEIVEITSANIEPEVQFHEVTNRPRSPTPEDVETVRLDEEQRKIQEELQYKKQKDQVQEELKEELQQRLIRDKRSKRPPRSFGPLTPQERPLVLPGGRRWRKPKDAYNDEFIAEVLSSQAELIVGSTLGVNFMKYQKPEKKIDLEKSEVYKIIHHLEKEPRRGIEARPPKVLAEEDVINRATPMSCG